MLLFDIKQEKWGVFCCGVVAELKIVRKSYGKSSEIVESIELREPCGVLFVCHTDPTDSTDWLWSLRSKFSKNLLENLQKII